MKFPKEYIDKIENGEIKYCYFTSRNLKEGYLIEDDVIVIEGYRWEIKHITVRDLSQLLEIVIHDYPVELEYDDNFSVDYSHPFGINYTRNEIRNTVLPRKKFLSKLMEYCL